MAKGGFDEIEMVNDLEKNMPKKVKVKFCYC